MSWVVEWVWDTLVSWGFFSKNARILFLGLDNAGKTTLLHMLRDDRLAIHYPTMHPTMEELTLGNIRLRTLTLEDTPMLEKFGRIILKLLMELFI